MKTKKILALVLSAAMVFSMTACDKGEANPQPTEAPSPVAAPSEEPTAAPVNTLSTDASLDFEDGSISFVGFVDKLVPATKEGVFSVADENGSKALKVEPNGNKYLAAIDLGAVLGDKVADVASIECTIGTDQGDKFYAVSGSYGCMVAGEGITSAWSVYLDTQNPKRLTWKVPEGKVLAAGDSFAVGLTTDNKKDAGLDSTTFYIDNVAFKDASGNLIAADSTAEFSLGSGALDPNAIVLADAVDLDFAVKGGGWGQAGKAWADIADAFFPGCVIEIEYNCAEPIWFVYNGLTDANGEGWGWVRGVNEDDHLIPGAVYSDGKIQVTYEDLVPFWGEDFEHHFADGAELQCEGSSDWEVYSIKVGKDSGYQVLGATTDLEMSVSGGAYAQAGKAWADVASAFKPGTIVEIEYSCAGGPVWFVYNGLADENGEGWGWVRAVNEDDHLVPGAAYVDGKIQFTYEQLASYWGEGFETKFADGAELQCEGPDAWEVYSIKVGTPALKKLKDVVELDFSVSGGGWGQAGKAWADIADAFYPGCKIEVEYSCAAGPVWFVYNGLTDANGEGWGWVRAVNEDDHLINGASYEDGKFQVSYEALTAYWGEDWEHHFADGAELQCEGQDAWEVYAVRVGK